MTHILGKGASGLRRRMRLGEIQTALAEIYFSILLSASAHSPRARPGFRPGKGSGQLRQLKTPSWRNQNQRRQPILFPLGKARTGCCCLSPAPAVLGTSRPRPKGHAESFPGMLRDIPRRDIQKAPGTMPDTYQNKLGLLRDKKCDQGGWGVGGRVPCAREPCGYCPNQRASPSSTAGVPNPSRVTGPLLRTL